MVRINKRKARKLFDNGEMIRMCACKMRPECGFIIDKYLIPGRTFDQFVNAYEYYNCMSETGRYAAYYVD